MSVFGWGQQLRRTSIRRVLALLENRLPTTDTGDFALWYAGVNGMLQLDAAVALMNMGHAELAETAARYKIERED